MTFQVLTPDELSSLIEDATARGYVKAYKEIEALKSIEKEPKFPRKLKGAGELCQYLEYKGYWRGSIYTLNKKTEDLRFLSESNGQGLIFDRYSIDDRFEKGFKFKAVK